MEGEVLIHIVNESEGGDNGTTIDTDTGEEKDQAPDKFNLAKSVLVNQFYNYAKQIIVSEASYEINKHFDLTDDYESKRDFNIAVGVFNKVKNVATSTATGAIAGAKFGAVGVAVGALIGFGGSTVGEIINVYQAFDKQNITMQQRNKQLEYTRQRAGYSLTSGSIGENL